MNYLAHIALSGNNPQHRIGGLLGDFVRGPLRGDYPAAVEQGIWLHRKIDVFVDRQPEVRTFNNAMPQPWRRYAGIVADVLYDHFLASDWHSYHPQPLDAYCRAFYRALDDYRHPLPQRARIFQQRAAAIGWLEGYALLDNIPMILQRIGQRFRRPIDLQDAFALIADDLPALREQFHPLYARTADFARQLRAEAGFLTT